MNNILVPIGSNKTAANTLQYAIDFAQGTPSKIFVIQVYGVTKMASSMRNIDKILEKDSEAELDAIINQVDAKGIEIVKKSIKGDINDSITRAAEQLGIQLIISSAKSSSLDEKIYLGKTIGGLIKHTAIPILVIPRHYKFKKISKVLMAIKSGVISNSDVLKPLKEILNRYDSKLDLVRIITPRSNEEDGAINKELESLHANYNTSENATIFQGLLEHLHASDPDLLCVIRRHRGFFARLWEDDRVYRKDFESRIPLLILKGAY
jgi:nucleotide-binding universal stress UspA family protein